MSQFILLYYHNAPSTKVYTLSLHDALPIYGEDHGPDAGEFDRPVAERVTERRDGRARADHQGHGRHDLHRDRKRTRLNSSHGYISYAVFCLKKKKKTHVINL